MPNLVQIMQHLNRLKTCRHEWSWMVLFLWISSFHSGCANSVELGFRMGGGGGAVCEEGEEEVGMDGESFRDT